jgi:uncharacterized protein YkwD
MRWQRTAFGLAVAASSLVLVTACGSASVHPSTSGDLAALAAPPAGSKATPSDPSGPGYGSLSPVPPPFASAPTGSPPPAPTGTQRLTSVPLSAKGTTGTHSRASGSTAGPSSTGRAVRHSSSAKAGTTADAVAAAKAVAADNAGGLTLGPRIESAAEAQVVTLVNQQRITAGCPALTLNSILITVARAHSKQMSESTDGIKHNSTDGRTPFQRMTAAGYSYSMAAENIAAGQPTAASVVAAWMGSEGHRENILNCDLTQIGVGMVYKAGSQYGTYWTQDFAAPM